MCREFSSCPFLSLSPTSFRLENRLKCVRNLWQWAGCKQIFIDRFMCRSACKWQIFSVIRRLFIRFRTYFWLKLGYYIVRKSCWFILHLFNSLPIYTVTMFFEEKTNKIYSALFCFHFVHVTLRKKKKTSPIYWILCLWRNISRKIYLLLSFPLSNKMKLSTESSANRSKYRMKKKNIFRSNRNDWAE